ncbi:MAG: hypothetical protein D6B28_01775 [Gammaproteobacteria bacterium]|nr:MAG: hypothetical protein D6B28_01775 [Gammaproteobacteria bacterium]
MTNYFRVILTFTLSISLVACGGGGGDAGDGDAPGTSTMQSYSGNTEYASLDAAQCSDYRQALFGSNGQMMYAEDFSTDHIFSEDDLIVDEEVGLSGTVSGKYGGSVSFEQSSGDGNIGWSVLKFNSLKNNSGYSFNGAIRFDQDQYVSKQEYHAVLSFLDFSFYKKDRVDMVVAGTYETDRMHPESYVESDVLNLLFIDNTSGIQVASEDLKFTFYENNQIVIDGAILHSEFGRVDIYVDGQIKINRDGHGFFGDSVIIAGGDSKCKFSYVSEAEVSVEIDADNDDVYESLNIEPWNGGGGHGGGVESVSDPISDEDGQHFDEYEVDCGYSDLDDKEYDLECENQW